nr:retrotransposon protein, putative, Ty1-copia subclass [Tanacetum cinerariifolium]
MCLYIDAEEHELGDLGEPANYKAALLDPESKKWLDAMNVEMQSMKDNDVWVLVELSLYVGDGHRTAVEATGTYHLELPSGLVIILNNFHYAQFITRGLLNSIDIESLGKCVSCMSGKMARKPYSHQVEMAKDLLVLIYTDVCGPFKIVSRQGASYFVTFTNEFSRYGYVYRLKHKHEVFETFRIFQKELENQLGKTIKSLRSDRGGYLKETIGYSFYNPSEKKVFVAQNAEFFESKLLDLKAIGSVEDLELIQEEDTNPSVDTSLDHEEDD